MKLGFQRVTVDTHAPDDEGRLVFAGNRLVAVLVRLSDLHGREGRTLVPGTWLWQFGRTGSPDFRRFG